MIRRGLAHPRDSSRACLYPYDDDAGELILGWLIELENGGFIRLYTIEGTSYLDIPKWLKHQKIDRPSPSRLPAYDDAEKQGGVDHRGGSFDEPSTSPREDASDTREPSRALDAGPRTVDLGPRTVDRTQTAPKPKASEPTPDAVLSYPCRFMPRCTLWPLTAGQADAWTVLYPSTDVLGECRKALAWIDANASQRKTARGMPKFLVGWLNRASPQPGGGEVGNAVGGGDNAVSQVEPKPCTCGDAYRNSFNRKCLDCDGKPSYAQMDAARAGAEVHEVKTLESIT